MPRIKIYTLAFLDYDYTPYHILKLVTKVILSNMISFIAQLLTNILLYESSYLKIPNLVREKKSYLELVTFYGFITPCLNSVT